MKCLWAWVIDLCLVLAASVVAFVLRRNFNIPVETWILWAPYLGFTLLVAAVYIPLLGLNRSIWRFSHTDDYARIAVAAALTVGTALVLSFGTQNLNVVSRAFAILQTIFIFLALSGARLFMRLRHQNRRTRVAQFSAPLMPVAGSVLIVGVNRLAELYVRAAEERCSPAAPRIAGLLGLLTTQLGRTIGKHPVLGPPEQVEAIIRDLCINGVRVDRIVVASRWEELSAAARDALLRVEVGSDVRLIIIAEALGLQVADEPLAGTPVTEATDTTSRVVHPLSQMPDSAAVRWVPAGDDRLDRTGAGLEVNAAERQVIARRLYWPAKRALDVFASLLLLGLTAPLIAGVALATFIDLGRPILFWQQRPGVGGRPFRVYKFRTMRSGHDVDGAVLSDETRVTRLGRFLRTSRLDELPQLVQVLAGQMSFIGPRPLLPRDQPAGSEARLLVRPGLTGWAQVNGGRALSTHDKAALDIWYVRHASFWLDVRIIVRTLVFLLRGEPTEGPETPLRPASVAAQRLVPTPAADPRASFVKHPSSLR